MHNEGIRQVVPCFLRNNRGVERALLFLLLSSFMVQRCLYSCVVRIIFIFFRGEVSERFFTEEPRPTLLDGVW